MEIIKDIAEMTAASKSCGLEGKKITFVPTMGYLHEGHLSLAREGKRRGDTLIVSIFVNPTQFDETKDIETYPVNIERDVKLLDGEGVDILFLPEAETMYGKGHQTFVEVTELSKGLCGDSRPGHFRGVATVMAKLFNIVQPDIAIFGEKDYQQLAIIRQMVSDLNFPVEIIGMPIVREPDGLAMSSRNARLSASERSKALSLFKALQRGKKAFHDGTKETRDITEEASQAIDDGVEIDYMEIRDSRTLLPLERVEGEAIFAIAARVGETRLIDNTILQGE